MSERFNALSARHRELRRRSDEQRAQIAGIAVELEQDLGRVDQGVNAVRRLARNPFVIGAAIAVLAAIGPRRLLSFASRAAVFAATAKRLGQLKRANGGRRTADGEATELSSLAGRLQQR